MQLDYSRLDPELLPILETFPALDITRDNIAEIRALMAETPRPEPPSGLLQRDAGKVSRMGNNSGSSLL